MIISYSKYYKLSKTKKGKQINLPFFVSNMIFTSNAI